MQKSAYLKSALILLLSAAVLAGCAKAGKHGTSGTDASRSVTTAVPTPPLDTEIKEETDESGSKSVSVGDISIRYTKYDLDDSEDVPDQTVITFADGSAGIDGSGAAFADGVLTVTAGGVYRLSGTLSEGRIVVAAPDDAKVRLILAGLDLTCSSDAAIFAQSADKVILTLAAGSVNTITDSDPSVRADGDTRAPAAIYGAVSLSINGSGSLTVNAGYNHAVSTKKTLKVAGGTLNLTAAGAGLKGNNAVGICGGEIALDVAGDGIKTEETEDTAQGYVLISGGKIGITSESDGINGSLYTLISGGEIGITTTGTEVPDSSSGTGAQNPGGPGAMPPAVNAGFGPGGGGGRPGGGGFGGGWNDSLPDAPASKGIKAGSRMLIAGGSITVDSTGHCVHSSGSLTVGGDADLTLTSSLGKGIQGHGDVSIIGGKIRIVKATEGIESKTSIEISGGDTRIQATDDGINLAGSSKRLLISGGSVSISVGPGDTDGIDSNGSVEITGGVVTVKAAYATGNMAAIDAQRQITVSGGSIVLLCGGSGLSESAAASLGTARLSESLSAGDYTVAGSDGRTVFSFTVLESANGVWIGSSLLEPGCDYLLIGPDGAAVDIVCQGGTS